MNRRWGPCGGVGTSNSDVAITNSVVYKSYVADVDMEI